ncbi:hypothetical protein [Desulfonatronospira sp.]|uniref:hypothetical protein n=1 Tax=Desulfonatronospira sp. TaxID=1962951 RepID=UPI0025BD4977|nr:hypothetical protein [Desulfonatronospira sp.]
MTNDLIITLITGIIFSGVFVFLIMCFYRLYEDVLNMKKYDLDIRKLEERRRTSGGEDKDHKKGLIELKFSEILALEINRILRTYLSMQRKSGSSRA